MSEPKFTPGPWKYDILGKEGVCVVIFGKDKLPLASLYHNPRKNTEQKANAHLISAAPEMYGILAELLEYRAIHIPSEKTKVEAVLKKARGEK